MRACTGYSQRRSRQAIWRRHTRHLEPDNDRKKARQEHGQERHRDDTKPYRQTAAKRLGLQNIRFHSENIGFHAERHLGIIFVRVLGGFQSVAEEKKEGNVLQPVHGSQVIITVATEEAVISGMDEGTRCFRSAIELPLKWTVVPAYWRRSCDVLLALP